MKRLIGLIEDKAIERLYVTCRVAIEPRCEIRKSCLLAQVFIKLYSLMTCENERGFVNG